MQRLPIQRLSSLMRRHLSHSHSSPALSIRRFGVTNAPLRRFSSISERDDLALEEEAERKVGWLLKLFFIGTAGAVGYQFFPYMGDTLLQQSISLLHVKDPLFKRMGASRLSRFAVDDERRLKVVELGGAQDLLSMLQGAKDDKTRKEALKALVALSHSGVLLLVARCQLHEAVMKLLSSRRLLSADIKGANFAEPVNLDFKQLLLN